MILVPNEKSNNYQEKSEINEINIEESTYSVDDIERKKEFNICGNNQQIKEVFYNLSYGLNEKEFLEKEELDDIKDKANWFFKDYFFFMDLYNKPVPIKEKIEIDEISRKSTDDKSLLIKKCIFGINSHKKIEPRIDYAIKYFKVNVIKFIKEYGNILIKLCDFPNKLKKLRLFSPSYKYFTGNSNEKDNKLFINFNLETIFCYPEGNKNDNRLQRQNKETIKCFKEYIEENYKEDIPEKYQKLLNYLNMTFQDAIVLFYESKQFNDYSSSSKTIFLDKYFTKAKGFSFLEKNGFLKLMGNSKKSECK